jgi:hypothetical protein
MHFSKKKNFFNSKKFWRTNYIKMGFGDWDQKWGLGKSLGAGGALKAFPNPQSPFVFF